MKAGIGGSGKKNRGSTLGVERGRGNMQEEKEKGWLVTNSIRAKGRE